MDKWGCICVNCLASGPLCSLTSFSNSVIIMITLSRLYTYLMDILQLRPTYWLQSYDFVQYFGVIFGIKRYDSESLHYLWRIENFCFMWVCLQFDYHNCIESSFFHIRSCTTVSEIFHTVVKCKYVLRWFHVKTVKIRVSTFQIIALKQLII